MQPGYFNTGDIIDDYYRVEAILGEGAFGIVYRVRTLEDNQIYALKMLKFWSIPPHEQQKIAMRFDQEYATGRIESDYLVQSLGKGMANGNPYIVMEYCPGGDLLSGVRRGIIDLPKAAAEILAGLNILHSNGKVHRDLKPENILIKEDGKAALTDFGIAGDRNKRMTERNNAGIPTEQMGTYAFMPPEQVNPRRGDATVLPTTDLFAFGVLIYYVLTGRYPFGSVDSESELFNYITRSRAGEWDRDGLLRAGGRQWLQLLEQTLHPDFNYRVQSAREALTFVPYSAAREATERLLTDAASCVPPEINGMALRIMQGEEYGKIYYLTDMMRSSGRSIITIGRLDPEVKNMVALREEQSNYISRRHCTLEFHASQNLWVLRDGQWDLQGSGRWRTSTNGTFIGSAEVAVEGNILSHGDIISVGDLKMRFEGY